MCWCCGEGRLITFPYQQTLSDTALFFMATYRILALLSWQHTEYWHCCHSNRPHTCTSRQQTEYLHCFHGNIPNTGTVFMATNRILALLSLQHTGYWYCFHSNRPDAVGVAKATDWIFLVYSSFVHEKDAFNCNLYIFTPTANCIYRWWDLVVFLTRMWCDTSFILLLIVSNNAR